MSNLVLEFVVFVILMFVIIAGGVAVSTRDDFFVAGTGFERLTKPHESSAIPNERAAKRNEEWCSAGTTGNEVAENRSETSRFYGERIHRGCLYAVHKLFFLARATLAPQFKQDLQHVKRRNNTFFSGTILKLSDRRCCQGKSVIRLNCDKLKEQGMT